MKIETSFNAGSAVGSLLLGGSEDVVDKPDVGHTVGDITPALPIIRRI